MKFRMRTLGCLIMMLCLCFAAAAEETGIDPLIPALELPADEGGNILPIPMDAKAKTLRPPYSSGYIYPAENESPTGYADPSITVNIARGRFADTDYVYARVRIADASQLRTELTGRWTSEDTTLGVNVAKRVKAVIAINGDYCLRAGIRQGEVKSRNLRGDRDVLVIDKWGDLHILEDANWEDVEAFGEDAVNVFTFGPGIVINGQPKYGYVCGDISSDRPAQRTVIAQTGPLEYLLLNTSGPEDSGNKGLTLDQLTTLVSSFPEVINAFNLDGGGSSTMVFQRRDGKKYNNWLKINATVKKNRSLKDIIYFSTAWEEN